MDTEPLQPSWAQYSQSQRHVLLLILFVVGTSNYIDRNIVGVLLEGIKAEFQVSDTLLGLLTGLSFALFYAVFGIPVARWADYGNRRHVISVCLLIWSVLTAVCGTVNSFWQLLAARFGVGAGEAGAIPPAQSLLADYYPPEQRARAIGIFMSSSAAGYAIGLIFGGYVAQTYGWRAALLIVGAAGIAVVPLTHFFLKEPRESTPAWTRPKDREAIRPAVQALFAKPAYRNVVIALVVYFLMAYGALAFIVSFMVRVHKLEVAQAGMTYGVVATVGSLLGSIGGGALVDRLAKRDIGWLARASGYGMMVAVPLYEVALAAFSVLTMTIVLGVATVVLNAVVPSMFSALQLVCGSRRRALAVAVAFFFSNLIGLGLGPLIAGALSDRFATAHGSAVGLRMSLMTIIPLLFAAGLLMLRTARHLRTDAED